MKQYHTSTTTCLLTMTIIVGLFYSCGRKADYNPLPRAYPYIAPPEGELIHENLAYCPFVFDRMSYATVVQDNQIFDEKAEHDCWFDIKFPEYNSAIHCSYIPLRDNADFAKRVEDAFKLTGKHMRKASFIHEVGIQTDHGLSGMMFLLEGPTATPAQFFLTDSVQHFFRGALYHDAQVNRDSTAPVTDYLMKDVQLLIESLRWREGQG